MKTQLRDTEQTVVDMAREWQHDPAVDSNYQLGECDYLRTELLKIIDRLTDQPVVRYAITSKGLEALEGGHNG